MADDGYIIALDQGTTSTRALAFDFKGNVLDSEQLEFEQHYPKVGWVEHDAEEIWQTVLTVLGAVTERMSDRGMTAVAMGITNQRETVVAFERYTGKPVHNAIVWQDQRTADYCATHADMDTNNLITDITGLMLVPYFSATKIMWLLEEGDLRARAESGEVIFGTIESYLIYRLTGCRSFKTDITNASRTMLCDIGDGIWDPTLLKMFGIKAEMLPQINNNCADFGAVDANLPAAGVPITAAIGDQQSAALGQGCINPGIVKSTYGTGCFVLQNTGTKIPKSNNKLLATIAYNVGDGIHYALEGSIFNAGTVTQFFRDQLNMIDTAEETEELARSVPDTDGVYMVPAFTGLGAPHWASDARGAFVGLTRGSNRAHLVRAGLESVVYQTYDLMKAFEADTGLKIGKLRIDGGMVNNNWLCQYLADILDADVERPTSVETTAWGAALLAGLHAGVWNDLKEATAAWQLDKAFVAHMDHKTRQECLKGWNEALNRVL